MPELPDVEVFRRYLDSTALHQEIAGLEVDAERVILGGSPGELEQRLSGCRFAGTRRHGKHLFAAVGEGWLAFHFGMTGYLDYHRDAAGDPAGSHAVIRFVSGYRLAFVDRRKLGHMGWVADPASYTHDLGLGPDAWRMGREAFMERARGRRGKVKCWLMDQSVMAGIGNVYSDEVLFAAGIRPDRSLSTMARADLDALYQALDRVLEAAVAAGADPERLPAGFLVPRRRRGRACPRCGSQLQTAKVCGRTSYHCPHCQPE